MELVDHHPAELLPHVAVPDGVRPERDLLHLAVLQVELFSQGLVDEWQWQLQPMLLINLFLNDGRIVELDIIQHEPLHGIEEDAFDIPLLEILSDHLPEEVAISFLL